MYMKNFSYSFAIISRRFHSQHIDNIISSVHELYKRVSSLQSYTLRTTRCHAADAMDDACEQTLMLGGCAFDNATRFESHNQRVDRAAGLGWVCR